MELQYHLLRITWLRDIPHGWGNGYVALPNTHPMFGIDYNDIPVYVLGGLSFGEYIHDELSAFKCGFPASFVGHYVVGFDTTHYNNNEENHPIEYVLAETKSLAKQLERFTELLT